MLVLYRRSHDSAVRAFMPPTDLTSRIRRRFREKCITYSFSRYLRTRSPRYERFSDDRSLYANDLLNQLLPCDIINLHWISGFVDYQAFFSAIPQHVPIFWRLSDMNALTGGCHYDHGCGKYSSGCGACPQLGSLDSHDLSHKVWERKKAVFSRLEPRNLHIIALNSWMAETVRKSPLLGKFPVTLIPNGVDTDAFAPRDIRVARDLLELPQDARILLFSAHSVINLRKGFDLLVQVVNGLKGLDNLFLLSVGDGAPPTEPQIPYLHLGHIDNDRLLSLVYSSADLHIIPSIQDNQPNTVLEAMSCGTPSVGFNINGISDMIRPGVTGILAPVGDVGGLRAAILELLQSSEKRLPMAVACRRIAIEEYARDIQVQRYAELYKSALRAIASNGIDPR